MINMFLIVILITVCAILLYTLNRKYFILAVCKRVQTVDGSPLETKIITIPGKTIFGNNLDILNMNTEKLFGYARYCCNYAKGKSYLLHFLFAPVYSITNAEDAEEVLQSQALLTKSVIYDAIKPFLGMGLLISADQKWHFRRKILTTAFHFNILENFIEIFKEESHKFIQTLDNLMDQNIVLSDIIPKFTLNNVCETALGVRLDDVDGSEEYRHNIHELEKFITKRISNPLCYYDIVYRICIGNGGDKYLKAVHDFSNKIIQKKRQEFHQRMTNSIDKMEGDKLNDEYGKKKRYAMLDTLLVAEANGQIDHQGICDEVNTFMFEGYDTTSACLMFTLLNLAVRHDVQENCYAELKKFDDTGNLTVFDLNSLEYLECVIKESLRLYPSVPFIARETTDEIIFNGLILPKKTQISIHIYDIMRDPKHFPRPEYFDPDRFLPQNTTNRHAFAHVPFSAGPRNCIGQKFAMLEMKILLAAIMKRFVILPVTRLEDIILGNGIILRTENNIEIKLCKRDKQ